MYNGWQPRGLGATLGFIGLTSLQIPPAGAAQLSNKRTKFWRLKLPRQYHMTAWLCESAGLNLFLPYRCLQSARRVAAVCKRAESECRGQCSESAGVVHSALGAVVQCCLVAVCQAPGRGPRQERGSWRPGTGWIWEYSRLSVRRTTGWVTRGNQEEQTTSIGCHQMFSLIATFCVYHGLWSCGCFVIIWVRFLKRFFTCRPLGDLRSMKEYSLAQCMKWKVGTAFWLRVQCIM